MESGREEQSQGGGAAASESAGAVLEVSAGTAAATWPSVPGSWGDGDNEHQPSEAASAAAVSVGRASASETRVDHRGECGAAAASLGRGRLRRVPSS